MGDAFKRHISELGPSSLWRGNFANCIRYVPTAAFNLAFKDNIKKMFPKYNKDTDFGKFAGTQIASGALAGGATNTLVYPLIYVRTVLGADLGKNQKFNGMFDCLKKTIQSNGVASLYNGIGPSTIGIVVYRGAQFGIQDILKSFNPYQRISLLLVLPPNLLLLRLQYQPPELFHILWIHCSVVSRLKLRNPRNNKSTMV